MKRKLSYLISTLVVAGSLLTPVVVLAHDGDTSTNSGSGSTSTSDSSDDTTEVETETKDMSERISKFKTHFKVRLNTFESAHIKLKCVGAQSVVGNLHTKFGNSVTVRTKAYEQLQKNLDKLVTKLKAKNVDTTALEAQIAELKAKITTYSTDLTAYKQALSDLKEVDCKTDPDGFQAALLAARTAHEKLVTDVTAIRSYLKDTIKPTLVAIRKQLETEEGSSSTEGGEQ